MPKPHYAPDGAVRTPGTSLHKGRIYRFRPGGVTVIDPWPRPQAWRKADEGEWRSCRPIIDLSGASPRHRTTYQGYRESEVTLKVPERVASAVLDAHLGGLQWASLQLAARVPGGLELLEQAPNVGAALAAAFRVRPSPVQRPLRSARALLRGRGGMKTWRRVVGWLGFDDSAAFVRVLRRVRSGAEHPLGVQDLVVLRACWADERSRKRLLHARSLDHNVLELVDTARRLEVVERLHPDLVEATFNGGAYTWLPRRFDQLVRSWPGLRPGRRFPVLRSAEALDALHNELTAEIYRERRSAVVLQGFPPPPLASAEGIEALATPEALRAESTAMANCLYLESWVLSARRRTGFGYRVSVGVERADVWLTPVFTGPVGTFRVMEARGHGNRPAPEACMERVESWLKDHHAALKQGDAVPETWREAWTAPPVQPADIPLLDDIPF